MTLAFLIGLTAGYFWGLVTGAVLMYRRMR